jgi:hypothetical protein
MRLNVSVTGRGSFREVYGELLARHDRENADVPAVVAVTEEPPRGSIFSE